MLWFFLLIFIVLLNLIIRWRNRSFVSLYQKIPCKSVKWLPIIGQSHVLLGDAEHQMKALQDLGRETTKQGGVMAMWHGQKLYIMITDPFAAEAVLRNCLSKDDMLNMMHIVMGNGSIFAPVPIWRPRRKVSAPMFSLKNLNAFVNIFAQQSIDMSLQLDPYVGRGPVSVWSYLNTYAMDSVCESTMGCKKGALKDNTNTFLWALGKLFQIATERLCAPWLHNDFLFTKLPRFKTVIECKELVYNFVDKIIREKRKQMENQANEETKDCNKGIYYEGNFKTFIDLLVQSSSKDQGYTDLELREEIFVLIMAGSDTSAVGAAFTFLMLSRNPDVQEKVYQELRDVFGDSNRPVVAEDLPCLKYLDLVIKESLRLYPPAPTIVRKVDTNVTLPSGVTLLQGCGVIVNIWGIHRNPNYWGPDVEEFRPERFIDTPLKHPAAFVPFSYGPRNCLGYQYAMMSMKTVVATLLRRYRVLPDKPQTVTSRNKPLRVKFDIMMRDVDNYTMQFEYRI